MAKTHSPHGGNNKAAKAAKAAQLHKRVLHIGRPRSTLPIMSALHEARASSLESLNSLLGRFREFQRKRAEAQKASYASTERFLEAFRFALKGGLADKCSEWERKNAPHFNVFRMLGIERRETKLHSRLIAELLNPSGMHGQRFKFLDSFFSVIPELSGFGQPSALSRPCDWFVRTEQNAREAGRLDIVLRCRYLRPHREPPLDLIIGIENKVDAAEGNRQIFRYDGWLAKQHAHKSLLLFLTPGGWLPETGRCVCISYRGHVKRWLEKALEGLEPPWLRSTLQQHMDIVSEF